MGTQQQKSNGFELGDEFARVLAETTQSLVCVLDEAGRVLLFNDACERATGFSRDEVIGRELATSSSRPRSATRSARCSRSSGRRALEPAGRPLADEGRRPPADRVVEHSRFRRPRRARLPRHLRARPHRARARTREEPALAGDPEAKLAEVGQLAQEQRALRRVATLVASEASPESVFMAVSAECARVLEVTTSAVWRYEGDDTATVVGRFNRDGIDPFPIGTRALRGRVDVDRARPRDRRAGACRGLGHRRGRDWPRCSCAAATGRRSRRRSSSRERSGARSRSAATDPLPPTPRSGSPPSATSSRWRLRARRRARTSRRSRARIVRAGDEQRRRLERNLHDGAQQRLVSGDAAPAARADPAGGGSGGRRDAAAGGGRRARRGSEELRELARGLHPGALMEHGLRGALDAVRGAAPGARRDRGARRAARPARRGDGVLHRLGRTDERRQARRRVACLRDGAR